METYASFQELPGCSSTASPVGITNAMSLFNVDRMPIRGSSYLASVGYDYAKNRMEVEFTDGAISYVHGDSRWTKERIIREKKRFLDLIKHLHFVNLTCSMAGIKESVVRTWIRTDPDFAEGVRSAQVRFGERVARAMMDKAVSGDLGAQMYTLKQFGDAVSFIDPEVSERSSANELQVDKLSLEEQETLLYQKYQKPAPEEPRLSLFHLNRFRTAADFRRFLRTDSGIRGFRQRLFPLDVTQ